MFNISDFLQKTWEEIKPNVKWDFVKWFAWGGFLILTTLSSATWWFWNSSSPTFQGVLVIGLLWFIGIPIIYLIFKSWKANFKNPAVENTNINEFGNKKLVELLNDRKENITDYVKLTRAFYCFEKLDDEFPYINFGFYISNDSLCEIVFDDKVKGYIEFNNERLVGDLIVCHNPNVISPLTKKASLTIKQRITESEIATLRNKLPLKARNFRLNNLIINYKDNANDIDSHTLEIYKEFAEENDIEQEYQEKIKRVKEKHKKQIYGHLSDVSRLKAEIEENHWIVSLAKRQAKNITEFVSVNEINATIEQKSYLHILTKLDVYNWSVFDINFSLDGEIVVWQDDIEKKEMSLKSEQPFIKSLPIIKKLSQATIEIEQRLSPTEIAFIRERIDEAKKEQKVYNGISIYPFISLDNLTLNFENCENPPNDFSGQLKLKYNKKIENPEITI